MAPEIPEIGQGLFPGFRFLLAQQECDHFILLQLFLFWVPCALLYLEQSQVNRLQVLVIDEGQGSSSREDHRFMFYFHVFTADGFG